jgi:DNA-binding IclR family transcriptional regulator
MSVKSSATVFLVLKRLAAEAHPVTAGEMGNAATQTMTVAVRALATLEAAGYAGRHNGTAGFVLGNSARTLAFAFMAQFPARNLAMPSLQQLTLETGLTSSLFVRLGWYAVRIGRIMGPSVLIHHTRQGEAFPLTQGAPALAMLAHLPETAFGAALARDHAERGAAEALRARTRAEGVAVASSPAEPALSDMAAPLFDRQDRVIAAIAVEGARPEALAALRSPDGAARRVMRELAAALRAESAMDLAHYDHIDADGIAL